MHFKIPRRYDVSKLRNIDIVKEFETKNGGAFEPLLTLDSTLDNLYGRYTTTTNNISKEVVWMKQRKAIDGMVPKTAELCKNRVKPDYGC